MELIPMPDTDNQCYTIRHSGEVVHKDDLRIGFLAYHQLWDRLIPCINKIYRMQEYQTYKTTLKLDTYSIENTWKSVLDFIEWYNHQQDTMPAIYYAKSKVLVIGNRLRSWLDVPLMDDFNEYPPIKRYFLSTAIRIRRITSTTIIDDVW
ncbi:hypothetical protein [Cyclobacterium sp.]|uniref:hypothetical protein n=1 Tax=Cyclobacterium sp. TaxID=1966343 RepID=UPI00198D8063|nr:hypothetical protein [Cyclobacterium sp.]MBD3627603.1 hypothetical protein [Cyclobacterium sp.]